MKKHQDLIALADACNHGACNLGGLIRSFSKAIDCLPFGYTRTNPAVKCILGHLSYLTGESLGPSAEALNAYDAWKAELQQQDAAALRAALAAPQLQPA